MAEQPARKPNAGRHSVSATVRPKKQKPPPDFPRCTLLLPHQAGGKPCPSCVGAAAFVPAFGALGFEGFLQGVFFRN
jgi:hypothetical protein